MALGAGCSGGSCRVRFASAKDFIQIGDHCRGESALICDKSPHFRRRLAVDRPNLRCTQIQIHRRLKQVAVPAQIQRIFQNAPAGLPGLRLTR